MVRPKKRNVSSEKRGGRGKRTPKKKEPVRGTWGRNISNAFLYVGKWTTNREKKVTG